MRYQNFKSAWSGVHEEKKFLRSACIGLVALNVLTSIGWLKKDRSVILIPPGLSEKSEIATNKASEGYKKAWGAYTAMLLGNVTPENADFVLDALAGMVSGEMRLIVVDQIAAELETLKEEKVSSTFEMLSVIYEPESDKVFVAGRNRLVGIPGVDGKTTPNEQTFEFKIDVKQYSPLITHMASYTGEPKILSVVQRDEIRKKYNEERQKSLKKGGA
jgi:conjugal transfer pilus assembly protein TraE